jgi:hypothetical protein
MKKPINLILFLGFIFCVYPIEGYCQRVNLHAKKVRIVEDQKFWFSLDELKQNAFWSKYNKEAFLRCYIDGLEFTKESPTKPTTFKDYRFVAKKNPDAGIVTICVVDDHPERIKLDEFKSEKL